MVGGPLTPPQEVMFVVTVPFQYCGELPRAQQLAFKHCFVFPDLFPADVLCGGKEASPQGRGQEMGANSSCFHLPFHGGGDKVQTVPLWQGGERKTAELLSTEGGRTAGLRNMDGRESSPCNLASVGRL